MMRVNLRLAACFAAWTSLCGLALPQDTAPPPPVQPAAQPDTPSAPAPDYLPSSLPSQIAMLLADPAVSRAHWGIMVTNLDGGLIFGLNQQKLFQPASNTKLFTTAAALALLGPDRHFQTTVDAEGTVSRKGDLHGNLVLRGGGDANFASQLFPYLAPAARPSTKTQSQSETSSQPQPLAAIDELADQVVAKGLKSIDGDVIGDDTYFAYDPYPQNWSQDDLLWGYGAPVSALTVHDNQIDVTVTPTTNLKPADVVLNPDLPYYAISAEVSTNDSLPPSVGFDREPDSKNLDIYGGVSPKTGPDHEEIAIGDPAEYAALALKTALEARGVHVKGTVRARHWDFKDSGPFLSAVREPVPQFESNLQPLPPGTQIIPCTPENSSFIPNPKVVTLATQSSPTVVDDILLTNKVSQNLHAEILLRNIAATRECEHTLKKALQWEHQFLLYAGLDPNDFVFYDGSGLSSKDLVTPRATAKLLQFATTQPWFTTWKASLPIGGEDGTLESRFSQPPLKDHLFAKTGTLGEARALSGYLDCASGRTVIFSIMVDNHLPGSTADRDVMDKIVAAIQAAE